MVSRRLFAGGLVAGGLAPAALAAPPKRQRIPADLTVHEVPFRTTRGVPWTTVQVDGGEAFPFGLNISQSSWRCHPSVVLGDAYRVGQEKDRMVRLKSVRIGGVVTDNDVPCASSPEAFEGLPVAGLIGLGRYDPCLIDWDRRVLSIRARRPETWTHLKSGADSVGHGPVVDALVDGRPARLIVASFVPWGLELDEGFVRRHRLWDHYPRRRNDVNAAGEIAQQTAVVGRLQLGDLAFDEVVTRLYDRPTHYRYHGQHASDGMIGYDLIRRMNFYINRQGFPILSGDDPPKVIDRKPPMHIRVAYSQARYDTQADDRAGFVLRDVAGALEIAQVDPKGPAAKAGLGIGDVVEAYDGDGGLLGLPYAVTLKAGTELRIQTSRNGVKTWRTVVLEDRI